MFKSLWQSGNNVELVKNCKQKVLFTFPELPDKSEFIVAFWIFFENYSKENRKHEMLMLYLLVSRAFAPTVKKCY